MIIGIVGKAGSGKSTVLRMIQQKYRGKKRVQEISFAAPFKVFAGKVFAFSDDQLYGPSHCRNGTDPRYSVPKNPLKRLGWFLFGGGPRRHLAIADARWRFRCEAPSFIHQVLGEDIGLQEFMDAHDKLIAWFERCVAQSQLTPRFVLQQLGSEWGRAVKESIWLDYALRVAREMLSSGKADIVVISDVRFLNEAKAVKDVGGILIRLYRDHQGLFGVAATHASEQEMESDEMQALFDWEIDNEYGLDDLEEDVNEILDELATAA